MNDNRSIILAIENISEQLRYEEQLQDAMERAEAASKAKTEFLSHITHELRCVSLLSPSPSPLPLLSLPPSLHLACKRTALRG